MINEKLAKQYCYEPLSCIQNYDEAQQSPETWDIHHRVEDIMDCGGKQLEQKGCYWDRPAHELVFTTHSDHMKKHYQRRKDHMKKARDRSLEKTNGRVASPKKFTIELDTGETILAESINQLSKALKTPYVYAWSRVKDLDTKSFIVIKHAIIRKASPEQLQTTDGSTQMNPDTEEAASIPEQE